MPNLALGPTTVTGSVSVTGTVTVQNTVPAWKTGQNTDIDTAYETLASQALVQWVVVKNTSTALQVLTLSSDGGSTDGWTLNPGEVVGPIPVTNASDIQLKASANNGSACWYGC